MEKVKRYWMHRISYEREVKQVLLENDGLLITGWGKVSNDGFLGRVWNKDREVFDVAYETDFGQLTRNRYCLYMFLNEFQKGDYVIVPGDRDFSVYEITGDKPFSKEHVVEYVKNLSSCNTFDYSVGKYYRKGTFDELELGFFWQVKPVVTNISRDGYADNALRKRLKFQMTNIRMTDLADSIEEAIKNKRAKKIINLRQELVEGVSKTILDKLKTRINDSKFEKVVEWYLQRLGATSTDIPAKRNLSTAQGDIDVIAVFDDLRVVVMVQAKQYQNEVDKNAVEQVVRASNYYTPQYPTYTPLLWVVATCDKFTEDAISYADENNVRLIGGDEFAPMILDIGIKDMTV